MRISKKKWQSLEKRVAALEKEIQGQRMLAPRVKVEMPNEKVTFDGVQLSKVIKQELSKGVHPYDPAAAYRYAALRDGVRIVNAMEEM